MEKVKSVFSGKQIKSIYRQKLISTRSILE